MLLSGGGGTEAEDLNQAAKAASGVESMRGGRTHLPFGESGGLPRIFF